MCHIEKAHIELVESAILLLAFQGKILGQTKNQFSYSAFWVLDPERYSNKKFLHCNPDNIHQRAK